MGDVVSLVEKAQESIDQQEAERMADKMRKAEFNLEDFKNQLQQIKKMGSLESIMGLIPGMGKMMKQMQGAQPSEKEMKRIEAMPVGTAVALEGAVGSRFWMSNGQMGSRVEVRVKHAERCKISV